jgi:serine/threonine protein kinase
MRKVCLLCGRTTSGDDLFCYETYCPAEQSPYILDAGEWLEDIEILRLVSVLRSSALYEAKYHQKRVLLKVAHPGREHMERLKREALLLSEIDVSHQSTQGLPLLLPAYLNTRVDQNPYGRTMFRGRLHFFCVFQYFDGASLRDVLIEKSQLWIYHIGWIMVQLATSVAFLQSKGLYHYGVCPDAVLVHFSNNLGAPRVLLADLGIAINATSLAQSWYSSFVPAAYTAPELVGVMHPVASYATDVYGLGLILSELLIGRPVINRLWSEGEILEAIGRNSGLSSGRRHDVAVIAQLADRAVSSDPTRRPASAADLAKELIQYIGVPPLSTKRPSLSSRSMLVIATALLALAFLIVMFVTLAVQLPSP